LKITCSSATIDKVKAWLGLYSNNVTANALQYYIIRALPTCFEGNIHL